MMGDLLGSLVWGAKSGQYCVIGGRSLQMVSEPLPSLRWWERTQAQWGTPTGTLGPKRGWLWRPTSPVNKDVLICINALFITQRILKSWWSWTYQNSAVKCASTRPILEWWPPGKSGLESQKRTILCHWGWVVTLAEYNSSIKVLNGRIWREFHCACMTKKYYLPPFLFSFKMIRNFSKQNHFMHLLPKDKFHNCIERFLHRSISRVVNKPSLSE
jgi:hypothetical protein